MPLDEVTLLLGPVAQASTWRRRGGWSIATSSRRTSGSRPRASSRSSTWAWPGESTGTTTGGSPGRPRTPRPSRRGAAGRRPVGPVRTGGHRLRDAHRPAAVCRPRRPGPADAHHGSTTRPTRAASPRPAGPRVRGPAAALSKDPNRRFAACQEFAAAAGCRFFSDVVAQPPIELEADVRAIEKSFRLQVGHIHLALTPRGPLGRATRSGQPVGPWRRDRFASRARQDAHGRHPDRGRPQTAGVSLHEPGRVRPVVRAAAGGLVRREPRADRPDSEGGPAHGTGARTDLEADGEDGPPSRGRTARRSSCSGRTRTSAIRCSAPWTWRGPVRAGTAEAALRIRGAMLGADALVGLRAQRRPGLTAPHGG